ncbi:MAG: helix-turn-helix domain-containing protein [Candidatus Limnocylindrales bacterium]
MLTVPEAARRAGKNPETIRRWIREGKLRAHKIGIQHVIEERDLDELADVESLPVPDAWRTTVTGRPVPNVVAALRRSRSGH